jgi:hypothetical protein
MDQESGIRNQESGIRSQESGASSSLTPDSCPLRSDSEADLEAQRDALRVQTAAVAAQQAALVEQEARLLLQQTTLTKQQEQLAAHLEDKRSRLEHLAEQVQTARMTFKGEQEEQLAICARQREELACGQAELEENRKKLDADRKRVTGLRRQLQQRFQRRWLAEQQKIRGSELEIAAEGKRLEQETAKLRQDREALAKARLSFNGEAELGKRQLQAQRQELQREQKQWKEQRAQQEAELAGRIRTARQRENALLDAERALGDDKHQWEHKRKLAEQEVYGLESRINNQRRKLLEQQHEISRSSKSQEAGGRSQESGIKSQKSGASSSLTPDSCPLTPDACPLTADGGARSSPSDIQAAEQESQRRAAQLDLLAGQLADQRLLLLEHWQRLVETQVQWHQERQAAADLLAALAVSLPHQERVLVQREHGLDKTEENLRQRQRELSQLRQHLEAWAARVRLRETTWESERDRLLVDIRNREKSADCLRTALVQLRQRWTKRRKHELELLKTQRLTIEKLRQEYATLRQDCWKRCLSLDEQLREASEKNLALVEYRQLFVLRCQDVAGVENKLDRLRKRWVQQNSQLVESTTDHFQRLEAEAAHLEKRGRELLKVSEDLSVREAKLAQQQAAWEEKVAISEPQEDKLRKQLQSVQAQRQRTEQQVAELQAEIERMARVLLDEVEEPPEPLAQAA